MLRNSATEAVGTYLPIYTLPPFVFASRSTGAGGQMGYDGALHLILCTFFLHEPFFFAAQIAFIRAPL